MSPDHLVLAFHPASTLVQGFITAASELWRPALSGPAPWLIATPVATGTSTAGAVGGASATGAASSPLVGTDISLLLVIASLAFMWIGLLRGLKRELPSLFATVLLYLVIGGLWDMVAKWVNHFYKLFIFAFVKRGILADDPAEGWKALADLKLPVPNDNSAQMAMWQIGFFTLGVMIIAYWLIGWWQARQGSVAIHSWVERILGGLMGAASGYLVAHFILARIIPGAYSTLFDPGTQAHDIVFALGPYLAAAFAMLLILLGVRSLGGTFRPRPY